LSRTPLSDRVDAQIREWNLVAEHRLETEDSLLIFGRRSSDPVVLKVIKRVGDEWNCGRVVRAFGGRGMVRVYEFTGGAVLLERLQPAHSLAAFALSNSDEEATRILAGVIAKLAPSEPPDVAVPVRNLAVGFQRHKASGSERIPPNLVERAQDTFLDLCESQSRVRLLHGDLHHHNVLFDTVRGWTAIDPKGLIGELEYELGAALRNPFEAPKLFAARGTIETRLACFCRVLGLNPRRVLRWAFAQAVLATIWSVEEGCPVDESHPFVRVSRAIDAMLATEGVTRSTA
jgi:streptomycin 6-kinase